MGYIANPVVSFDLRCQSGIYINLKPTISLQIFLTDMLPYFLRPVRRSRKVVFPEPVEEMNSCTCILTI